MRIESVVFCEGFHDRAFWKGWLTYLGCTDPGAQPPGVSTRPPIYDPWDGKVANGQFAFRSPRGHFVRLSHCRGKSQIMRLAKQRLMKHTTEAVRRIIINEDSDLLADAVASGATHVSVENLVKEFDPHASQIETGEWQLFDGTVGVSLVLWSAADPHTDGVPQLQTLERLVAAAICAAYPGRGTSVKNWLDTRPLPPATDVKEFSWSYMAGWYASLGGEAFFSNLWNDPLIATELETRLEANGALPLVRDFVAE